ncbi:MAG: hypothetical protein SNJ74_06670 [Fimbriimonadaceae bacterium]
MDPLDVAIVLSCIAVPFLIKAIAGWFTGEFGWSGRRSEPEDRG